MKRLWLRMRSAWRAMTRSNQLDREMQDEMRFQVAMESARLKRAHGLSSQEAERQAYVRCGGVEKYKDAGRDARGMQWLDGIRLDSRFGIRMLVKHRGLSIVGVFALAVGIAVGATLFEVLSEILDPGLPFADGDRVVALHYVASNPGRPERRVLHDFAALRGQLTSVEHLGAFRNGRAQPGLGVWRTRARVGGGDYAVRICPRAHAGGARPPSLAER